MIPRWLSLLFLLGTLSAESMFKQSLKGRCQKIEFDLCKDIPYNMTFFPNPMLGQDQQNIDSLHMYTDHFKPLILTKCHPHLKFFVCSVFAPMCPKDVPQAVTSCKSLCEQVKAGCKSLLDQYGLAWPELLECDRFPEINQGLCMNPPEGTQQSPSPSGSFARPHSPSKPPSCPSHLVNVDPQDSNGACALPCEHNTFFTKDDKRVASSWMVALGAVNLALAAFTFLTYIIDRHRFRFPERCVFFMSLCMAILSIPNLFLLFWRFQEMACEQLHSGQSYVTFAGFENHRCLLSFSLIYYFSTAASLWWLMFAFTWYLSAGRRWVPEGVEACSPYVHLIAWGTAALATIVVLVMRRVDASELTGLCSVGNQDPESLLYFSLLPRLSATLLGVFFIVAGLSGMCKEGQSLRRRGTDTSKNEKLVLKMIMFCIFYLLPMCTVLVCDYLHFHDVKATSRATIECKLFGGVEAGLCKQPPRLQPSRYLLQLIMGLLGGGACALWILSPKTFSSWQRFLCCGMCSPAPQKSASAQRLASSSRPLIEPQIPVIPHPPHPPTHYAPLHSQHSTQVWRPSNVV
ncbi:unnamed protein product, partial [Mesorhabditis belari]|uniref:Frizzled-4 n=1 Tax=Mesorhabditis belari TaxID=2138241 RepID=A0AAF3EIF6_9BILA